MPEKFGALEFPVQVPAPHLSQSGKVLGTEALGDPALTRLADYFQAFVNAYFTTAWQSLYPGMLPVDSAFTHDPNKVVFNTRDLPAIFLFRTGDVSTERLGEDILLETSRLRLLWVFPPRTQEDRRSHQPAANAVSKLLQKAIEVGRDPSYKLATDLDPTSPTYDPTAATQGTVIYRVCGLFGLTWMSYKISDVQIAFSSDASRDRDGARGLYECLDAVIEMQEQNVFDVEAFPLNRGADLTVTTPDKARDLAVAKL